MLLQLAVQDIGQLTDIELRNPGVLTFAGARRFCAGRLVYMGKASSSLASGRASLG